MDWLKRFIYDFWLGVRRHLLICDCREIVLKELPKSFIDNFSFLERDRLEYALAVDRMLNLKVVPCEENQKWIPVWIYSYKGNFEPRIENIITHWQIVDSRRKMGLDPELVDVVWIPEGILTHLNADPVLRLIDNSSWSTPPNECIICLYKEGEQNEIQ